MEKFHFVTTHDLDVRKELSHVFRVGNVHGILVIIFEVIVMEELSSW